MRAREDIESISAKNCSSSLVPMEPEVSTITFTVDAAWWETPLTPKF